MAKFIDLGRKASNDVVKQKLPEKPYYPTTHLSGVKAEVGVGDEITIIGRVKRATEEDDGSYSCDVECLKMSCDECSDEGGLDGAIEKISKKRQGADDEV